MREVRAATSIIKDFAFSTDGRKLLTASQDGVVRSWFFGDFPARTPEWLAKLDAALSGLHVADDVDVQRVSEDKYVTARLEFAAALRKAAASGDEGASFLLAGRKLWLSR